MFLALRWRWLGELKQSDGGFRMSVGGEEDVRYGTQKTRFLHTQCLRV